MDESCFVRVLLIVITLLLKDTSSEHIISNPQSVALPKGFTTLLTCEMTPEPDRFEWKFYAAKDPYDPNAYADLSTAAFRVVSEKQYSTRKRKSELTLHLNTSVAGEYQCLGIYGSKSLASVPSRVTIAKLDPFPKQNSLNETVVVGSTVIWRCDFPKSNPEATLQYLKNNQVVNDSLIDMKLQSLILPLVNEEDSGVYTCAAKNPVLDSVKSPAKFDLKVVQSAHEKAPYFLMSPKDVVTVLKGHSVFLECTALGNPVPKVVWMKQKGQLPASRVEVLKGGIKIKNVTAHDEGVYICNHTNSQGSITHRITLVYNEEPKVNCGGNDNKVREGDNLDLECVVTGTPEPHVTWYLNGHTVTNDSSIEAIGNKIYFRPVEARHAGNLQLFARNVVRTVYGKIHLNVLPPSSAGKHSRLHHKHKGKFSSTKKHKPIKIIPPSKPTVSRLNDEAVVVRWTIPHNPGLGVQFFKVQYRELGPHNSQNKSKSSGWRTTNAEIPANIRDFDVTGLKPNHVYRFRVAAVYTNNDHKLSPNSDKFHLKRLDFELKNPLPVPLVTDTEPVNTTCIRIHWKINKSQNATLDGFYINYMPATTAGDYMKVTVEGADADEYEYLLNYLQPDTIYDIKLQSYNSRFPSDFSPIMKARTKPEIKTVQRTTQPPIVSSAANTEKAGLNLYVIVAGAIIGCGLLICTVALVFVCRKRNKKTVNNNATSLDDQYGSGPIDIKASSRSNGMNKITITSNPLADVGNQDRNVLELNRLNSMQNNNRQGQNESESGAGLSSPRDKVKSYKKNNKEKIYARGGGSGSSSSNAGGVDSV